jgi:hypothetical protein
MNKHKWIKFVPSEYSRERISNLGVLGVIGNINHKADINIKAGVYYRCKKCGAVKLADYYGTAAQYTTLHDYWSYNEPNCNEEIIRTVLE